MTVHKTAAIAYRIRNEGAQGAAPILYIHGAMSNKHVWLMAARELAVALPDRTGYLIDLPGHGESGGDGCDTIADYATAVLAFMDALELSKVALVGHSMGGAISQQIAIDQPDRVERLVLIATGARLGADMVIQAMQADFEAAADMIKGIAFGPNTPANIFGPVLEQMKQTGQKVSIGDFTACHAFNSVDSLSKIQAPAMVCCGDKDMLTPPKKNRLLSEALQCAYHELSDTGHMIQVERPDALAAILAGFLGATPAEESTTA